MRSWIPWAMTSSTEQRIRSRRLQARKAGRQLLGQDIAEITLARIAREIEDGKIAMADAASARPSAHPPAFPRILRQPPSDLAAFPSTGGLLANDATGLIVDNVIDSAVAEIAAVVAGNVEQRGSGAPRPEEEATAGRGISGDEAAALL
jgi:hypothetical protein